MLDMLSQIATIFGPSALFGFLIGLICFLYHRAVVKSIALPIINELCESGKLRKTLTSIKTSLLARLIYEAKASYYKKYSLWLTEQGYYEEDLNGIETAFREEDYKEFFSRIFKMFKNQTREKMFDHHLLKGKIPITEEEIEFIDRYLRGVRFIDKLFEMYPKALHLRSNFAYSYVILAFITALGALLALLKADIVLTVLSESFIGFLYFQNIYNELKDLTWAKKHIFALKAKCRIDEVVRYVMEQA